MNVQLKMFPVPGRLLSSQTGFFSHTIDGIFHLPAGVRQSTGAVLAEHTTPTLNLPEGPLEALGIDEGFFGIDESPQELNPASSQNRL